MKETLKNKKKKEENKVEIGESELNCNLVALT
jgi:hypothetical protein